VNGGGPEHSLEYAVDLWCSHLNSVSEQSLGARRKFVVTALFVVGGALVAYEASQYILDENYNGMVYAIGSTAGILVALLILKDWRKGLYLFLAWLLFEDLVRKYMGNNMVIYFAKDVLALITMLACFADYLRKRAQFFRPPFLVPLLVFVWLGILQVFNPASSHPVFGLMGLKLYFFYMPLVFVGYALVESEADIRKFFWCNIILADLIAGLGIAQSILGHTFLNPERPADDLRELSTLYRTAPLSGIQVYRPTSVFVSDGRFASYITLSLLLAFGFASYLLLKKDRRRMFSAVSLAIIAIAAVLSASRGALLWSMLNLSAGSVAFLWGAPWKQREVIRVLRTIWRTAFVIAVALLILLLLNPAALLDRAAFYSETLMPGSEQSELAYRVYQYPMENFLSAFEHSRWMIGYGIGTASLGVQYVARYFKTVSAAPATENGYGTLIIEFGISGLVLWILISASIAKASWRIIRSLKGTVWFPLAFVLGWFAFLILVPYTYNGMAAYQNFVINAYLWLLIGILFRIPKLAAAGAKPGQPGTVKAKNPGHPAVRIAQATAKSTVPAANCS